MPAAVVVLAIASLIAGCSAPAYQMDLSGTDWTILEVDGQPVEDASVSLIDDGLTVVIDTPCGAVRTQYAWDTDGNALGFGAIPQPPSGCTGEAAAVDRAVTEALRGVEEWRVIDSAHVEFLGAKPIRLERSSSDIPEP